MTSAGRFALIVPQPRQEFPPVIPPAMPFSQLDWRPPQFRQILKSSAVLQNFTQAGSTVVAGGSTLLTTLTLVNTSGSTQAANFVTPMFGHPFKKGDIGSADFPKFETTGGTDIPYTTWGKTTWSDGSWKFAGFMLRVPSSIAGSGTLTINVKNGGAAQGSSGRATSDLSAQDLKLLLTGKDNLTSGPWTSALNTGISDNDDLKVVGDGQAGKVWRIRQQFMSGGAGTDHGQLECYHYVAALQDSSNALYGIRWLPFVTQPWLDIDSPAKIKRDFSATIQNGASTSGITQPSALLSAPSNFTVVGNSVDATCTGTNNFSYGTAVRLTTTGTLPAPLALNTTYYTRAGSTSFLLCDSATNAINNFGIITPTNTGSGVHTATPHIEIVQFASFYGSKADGSWQYLQGGGSVAADATVRVQFNTTYWRSTKMVPPYDLTQSPNDFSSVDYQPNGHGQLRFFFNATGEDETIGEQPGWVAAHFLKQNAVNERSVRVSALSMAHCSLNVKRQSTGTLLVVNNTSYSGMGTPQFSWRWNTNTGASSFGSFAQPTGDTPGCVQSNDSSHWPSAVYYAYLITGEPQYADLMAAIGNYMVLHRATDTTRNPANGLTATQRYGCCFQDPDVAREDAWGSREVGLAAGVLPDSHWENANIKTYLGDLCQAGYDSINDYNANQSSFWTTNGIYHFRVSDAGGAPWQITYLIGATSFVYAVTEKAAALTFLNHLVKWPTAVDADVGVYHWTAFSALMRTTDGTGGPLVTALSQIHWDPGGGKSASCTASNDTVTITVASSQFTITNGDKVLFSSVVPAGLVTQTSYFAVNVSDPGSTSDKTLKVSATNGGAALDITADAGFVIADLRMQNIPGGGHGLDYATDTDYTTLARGAFRFAEAVGATGMGSIRTKMDTYFTNGGRSFGSAKVAFVPNF